MKRYQAVIVLVLACGFARAGELEAGKQAWERNDFAQAHQIFSKLAAAGNAEAERQLGEMHGFGEGVPEDLVQARRWLEQSRAHGNKDAAASLALVEMRATHKADIARYTHYDGADVALDGFNCEKPEVPPYSPTKENIAYVSGEIAKWYACYGKFAENLKSRLPPGIAIPEETAQLMNGAELAQAQVAMDQAYVKAAADGKRQADAMVAEENRWITACLDADRILAERIARHRSEKAMDLTEKWRSTFHPIRISSN